mmetsp:Transcript_5863/g.16707  ORF Transcript_5863/g.16707 Transcript_5863/m.16707 type:complete len:171 (+) Transcript_5863:256-768(+)
MNQRWSTPGKLEMLNSYSRGGSCSCNSNSNSTNNHDNVSKVCSEGFVHRSSYFLHWMVLRVINLEFQFVSSKSFLQKLLAAVATLSLSVLMTSQCLCFWRRRARLVLCFAHNGPRLDSSHSHSHQRKWTCIINLCYEFRKEFLEKKILVDTKLQCGKIQGLADPSMRRIS